MYLSSSWVLLFSSFSQNLYLRGDHRENICHALIRSVLQYFRARGINCKVLASSRRCVHSLTETHTYTYIYAHVHTRIRIVVCSAGVDAAYLFAIVIRFLPVLQKNARGLQLKSRSGKPRGQVRVDAPLPRTIRCIRAYLVYARVYTRDTQPRRYCVYAHGRESNAGGFFSLLANRSFLGPVAEAA